VEFDFSHYKHFLKVLAKLVELRGIGINGLTNKKSEIRLFTLKTLPESFSRIGGTIWHQH